MKSFTLPRLLAAAGLLLALIAVGSGPSAARAATLATGGEPAGNVLQISPAKQLQYVVPGQTYVYYYKVFNSSNRATGAAVKFAAASDARWPVVVSPAWAIVPANATVEIKVQVSVP